MVALFFLLLGSLVLLVAACRIWMNATPGTLKRTTSVTGNPGVDGPRHMG